MNLLDKIKEKIKVLVKQFPAIYDVALNVRSIALSMYYSLTLKRSNTVFFEGCALQKRKRTIPHNWGDDINEFFFEHVTGMRFQLIPFSQMHSQREHYLLIGSILGFYNLDNTIIYGTGVLDPQKPLIGHPNRVLSVRGPLTRELLLKNRINCPEIYGDPALLMPLFYNGTKKPEYTYGIILNMGTDEKTIMPLLNTMQELYRCKIINMTIYNKWTDIIDDILSCEMVISESLHGLIVSETYAIPSVWVEFKQHPDFWAFKFNDFYSSINKNETSIRFFSINDMSVIKDKMEKWQQGFIDYELLLDVFPFKYDKRRIDLKLVSKDNKRLSKDFVS